MWARGDGLRQTCGVVRGLLLDFYGTVVDEDDEVIAGICRAVADHADGVTSHDVGTLWSRSFAAVTADAQGANFRSQRELGRSSLAGVADLVGSRADIDALCERQFAHWRQPPLRPGTLEFLARTRLPVCVLSNIDRADVEAAIAYHDLPLAAAVTSEDVRAYKPAPQMFARGLAVLDLPAADVLHIGDSVTADVAGAIAAGIPVAYINRLGRPAPPGVAYDVAHLGELRLP